MENMVLLQKVKKQGGQHALASNGQSKESVSVQPIHMLLCVYF